MNDLDFLEDYDLKLRQYNWLKTIESNLSEDGVGVLEFLKRHLDKHANKFLELTN